MSTSTTALDAPRFAPPAGTRPGRRAGSLTVHLVFVGRSLRHTLRNVDALSMAMILPVMLMLLFTYVFGGAIDSSGDYKTYVVPGIILLCAGFGASSAAVDVTEDMTNGIVNRFRTMPLPSSAVIVGHVVASLVRNLVATAVVVGVALLVGFRPDAGVGEWLGAIGLIALYILAITWLFAGLGLVAKTAAAASGYGFVLLFLPYLSSAFVPVDTMPSWLQWIAGHQPITPVIETIRGLLTGTPMGNSPWWALAWCCAILVFAAVWGATLFRRKSR